ncbi:DUF2255 family protein [Leifsonia shinshuensis]|uniref:DUF2255 family protein n=1 Tax=Leifsonia shinshuensis TaxID=150026 RepID=A0A853D3I6_9MICO|nr:DUF2255 family protein [Leifsonia shinshuensis]NYJ25954.1 hypothetical protein [Leifsonia shinshuensis]
MRAWTDAELRRFDAASSLRLSAGSEGDDSVELGMVTVGQDLFIRAFSGVRSRWFQAAVGSGVGTIQVDGRLISVRFQPSAGDDRRIEAAYRERYGAAAALVGTAGARAATLLITANPER